MILDFVAFGCCAGFPQTDAISTVQSGNSKYSLAIKI
jgi:hypothetical protein